jgi:LacI family transcriptional regulator
MAIIRQTDIAKILNVSRVTVSKALKGAPDISAEMKRKVRQTADELGYIPHYHASVLHSRTTKTIGVVVPDVANSFFSYTIHGIMDVAQRSGYHIILTVSRESAQLEKENILTLLSMRTDGILVAITKETVNTSVFETVRRTGTPLVFFDRALEALPFSSVGIDDRGEAKKLVEHLFSCGYRKIAHLSGSSLIAHGRDRRTGYLDVLREHHLPVHRRWIIAGGYERSDGYEGFKKLWSWPDKPEAVFMANDHIALGAYDAMSEMKIHVPRDVGVAAMGHREFAELLSPSLTIIHVAPDRLGEKAMDLLLYEIQNPGSKKQKIMLPAELQVKESTRFLRKKENL